MTGDRSHLDDQAASRLQAIIAHAVDGLSDEDRAQRIEWCRRTNTHGVRAFFDDDTITLEWGGARLAVIDRNVLTDEHPTFTPVFVPEYDTLPDEWAPEDQSRARPLGVVCRRVDGRRRIRGSDHPVTPPHDNPEHEP